ncbi:MAG: ATP-dependent serine protease [Flavobacteriales bacterium]|nr:MAG: ATP-dependent serine protease [Flavobacteriales bacterium]
MVFDLFPFEDDWFDAFDCPQTTGSYFVSGLTGNGKTSFTCQLLKYLSQWRKCAYNSREEGISPTMQKAFRNAGMNEVNGKVILINEDMQKLDARLKKRRSPEVIVLDSWQYLNFSFAEWIAFLERHPTKLFIVISQVEGKVPLGQSARRVQSHACLKIWVEGHRAISKGRYIGKVGFYNVWREAALKYWDYSDENTNKNQQHRKNQTV